MSSQILLLYLITSLIWGTTWYVIKFQLATVGIIPGVFYRFLFASLISFLIVKIKNYKLQLNLQNHFFLFLQGVFNFSINYLLVYWSEKYISSALAALIFTSLIYFNMFGLFFFYKRKIEYKTILGSFVGIFGVFLISKNELGDTWSSSMVVLGVSLSFLSTLSASIGNMISIKNHHDKIPVMVINAWSMMYGSLFTLFLGLIRGDVFYFHPSFEFFSSLLYLTVFGTVIAFYAYQTLIKEIGAHKAAYTSILSPVVAVGISLAFESLVVSAGMFWGMSLALLGNYLVLFKRVHKKSI